MNGQNNPAVGGIKYSGAPYAFFYLLSLVSLVVTAVSVGSIVFQMINKWIIDVGIPYSGIFQPDSLKMSIAAIIIAAPVYYFTTYKILKSLYDGQLPADSGIRRWLSYFILFISSVIVLGYLIGVLYNFLDGELTLKFFLKALTAILISGSVFGYYLYDVKRKNVVGVKDKVIRILFIYSLVLAIGSLVAAFLLVESPQETRNKRIDQETLSKLQRIENEIMNYFRDNKKLPETLETIKYLEEDALYHPKTREKFEYHVLTEKQFELCAVFKTASTDEHAKTPYYPRPVYDGYGYNQWDHPEGRYCFKREVIVKSDKPEEYPVVKPLR
ncbi:MAG: hypothetical protein HY602_00770 [Parcubacteria group bacterium]|nr:hypothetical protein [Parcubacteria group bacterium]